MCRIGWSHILLVVPFSIRLLQAPFLCCVTLFSVYLLCDLLYVLMIEHGPYKANEFACNGHSNDIVLLSMLFFECMVAFIQPLLRFIGDGEHGQRLSLSSFAKHSAYGRSVSIVPGGFDQNAACVTVARFGDAAAPNTIAAAVLAGHQTQIRHQAARVVKSSKVV